MLEFGLYKEVAEVSWASVCNERIIRKHISSAVRGLKYRKVFGNDLVKALRGWVVGDHKWDTLTW